MRWEIRRARWRSSGNDLVLGLFKHRTRQLVSDIFSKTSDWLLGLRNCFQYLWLFLKKKKKLSILTLSKITPFFPQVFLELNFFFYKFFGFLYHPYRNLKWGVGRNWRKGRNWENTLSQNSNNRIFRHNQLIEMNWDSSRKETK